MEVRDVYLCVSVHMSMCVSEWLDCVPVIGQRCHVSVVCRCENKLWFIHYICVYFNDCVCVCVCAPIYVCVK